MQFIGLDNFLKDKDSFLYQHVTLDNNITNIKMSGGYIHSLYASKDTSLAQYDNEVPTEWEIIRDGTETRYITLLLANYDGTCNASPSDIDTNNIDAIRIKRRIKNSNGNWETFYEKKITATADLNFTFTDYLNKNNCDYQYNIVLVKNGTETHINNIIDVHSSFDGIYFTDGKAQYGTIFDIESNYVRKISSSTVQPINSRHPVTIKNGHVNYSDGSITARFLKVDENCDVDLENNYQYRKEVVDFLSESNVLVFKNYDGLIAIVSIGDEISEQFSDHYLAPKISFSWTQNGDAENFNELRLYGLIGGDE